MKPTAWLVRRLGRRGPTYSIRWTDRMGKCRSRSLGADKALARRMLAQKREELARGIAGDAIDMPWDQFTKEELELAKGRISPTAVKRLETAFNAIALHCAPPTVGAIDYKMLERFITLRGKDCEPATTKGDFSYLHAALVRARKRGYINQVPEFPRVIVPEKPMRVLVPGEIQKLLDACQDDRQRTFVWLSLTLGTRMSETLNLWWSHVTLADCVVRIECRDDWKPKNRRNRIAYLDPRGVELLQRLLHSAPKMVTDGQIAPKEPWIFLSEEGGRWGQNIQRTWRNLVKRAGIAHAGIHSLRRTFISGLVAAGVQQSIVTSVAGHQSPSTTYKYYTSIPSEACRKAVTRLPWVVSNGDGNSANPTQEEVKHA